MLDNLISVLATVGSIYGLLSEYSSVIDIMSSPLSSGGDGYLTGKEQ